MSVVKMNKYGVVLTGREYGKNAAKEIFSGGDVPTVFDFAGVASMGSSFGDEIFKMAESNKMLKVEVVGANKVVLACLKQVQDDLKIEIQFKS